MVHVGWLLDCIDIATYFMIDKHIYLRIEETQKGQYSRYGLT
jgi:hypothetical protein